MESRWSCREWRRWIRPLLIAGYAVTLVVVLPVMIVEFQLNDTVAYKQERFIGGLFVILAVPISVWGIVMHLIHYNEPHLQKYIVRILWMVPIYAGNAWLAMCFTDLAIYLDTARECYEAYVIYNFMAYLLAFLTRRYGDDFTELVAEQPPVYHIVPFCCCNRWQMGSVFISNCRHGVLQYTVIRPLTTIVALICVWCGVYNDGEFSFRSAWMYLVIINNCSQVWAMYCLILFYRATRDQLAPLKPLSKFICVKAIVFMSFWQSVLISILVHFEVIEAIADMHVVANQLQDWCICVEMFIAAIAHYFSFSYEPYVDRNAPNSHADWWKSFRTMIDVSDVRDDVIDHIQHVSKQATSIVTSASGKSMAIDDEERNPLLNNNSGGDVTRDTSPAHCSRDPSSSTEHPSDRLIC